jgi:CRP-like cAMP-binding protein
MLPEIEIYHNYLSSFDENLREPFDGFFKYLSISTLKKNSIYLSENTVPNELGFIVNGLIRSYIIDANGNDKTINFFPEKNYVGDYEATQIKVSARYTFQCLERTTLVHIPYTALQEGLKQNPGLEKHARILAEKKLSTQNSRLKRFLTQTAEQRYLFFVQNNPELFNRISLTHLSSYLGIERQSLTRIRKNLVKK